MRDLCWCCGLPVVEGFWHKGECSCDMREDEPADDMFCATHWKSFQVEMDRHV